MHSFFFWLKNIRDKRFLQLVLFTVVGLFAFYKTFSFWFYHGWETSWLGAVLSELSLVNLMRSHGLISYMNLLLFGWRPAGWFVTALIFHIMTAMIINIFISKKTNKTIGVVAGLLFLVTTAHHDVVTWGSFESLYAVQTLCFYLGLWSFDVYRITKKMVWYTLMLAWFLISLVIRESGLIFLPLVFLYDAVFYGNIFTIKMSSWPSVLFSSIKHHALLWGVAIAYILSRASYGGSGHDFIDERVQFRILLFKEHRYLEYIWYGILSFGHFIGPYVIPYPALNLIRDIVTHFLRNPGVKIYFFSAAGWLTYAALAFIVWTKRKSRYAPYVFFSFLAFTAVTLFYSFAWTTRESFLASPYGWSENRWRYLGFTFFAAIATIIFHNALMFKRKKLLIGFILITFYLATNMLLLHRIEDQMFRENSKPAVLFYDTFQKAFPTLSSEDRFYTFRSSAGLNDYMLELSTTYPSYYREIRELPKMWTRSDMYYVLKGFREHADWTKHLKFIDYTADRGVSDQTAKATRIIADLKPQNLNFSIGTDSAVIADASSVHPVDFRYTASVSYRASQPSKPGTVVDRFSSRLATLMENTKISACPTMGDEKEPFYDLRTSLALDGNIGARSYWWANCRPAWITLDLGSRMIISGAAWSSVTHTDAFPRDYTYEISDDGKTWEKVVQYRENAENSRIDIFETAISARFIRLWVEETSYRQMVRIDEFVPLFPDTVDVAAVYKNLPDLYKDMHEKASWPTSWMKAYWVTEPDNTVPAVDTTMYVPIVTDGAYRTVQFELLESDFYSALGQFLRRKLTSIRLEVPYGIQIGIANIELAPQK